MTVNSRNVAGWATVTLLASFVGTGCATTNFATPTPQENLMNKIHPSTSVSYRLASGTQSFELNDPGAVPPTPNVERSDASALFHQIELEHSFASQLGVYFAGEFGAADDILDDAGISGSSLDTTMIFLALSYRATIDDDFRIPMRFGPYMHTAEVDFGAGGDVEYSTVGLKLSAAPEYIIFQNDAGARMSELSVFVAADVGTGPSKAEASGVDETGYSFNFGAELGLRYKFSNTAFVGLSGIFRKSNYGVTDSYDDATYFFGVDDDFTGAALTLGSRF